MDLSQLCEQCNEKENAVEEEEKDPVDAIHLELAQRNNDEGQHQRQTQRSCENPRQQAVYFKLRRRKRHKMHHVHRVQNSLMYLRLLRLQLQICVYVRRLPPHQCVF